MQWFYKIERNSTSVAFCRKSGKGREEGRGKEDEVSVQEIDVCESGMGNVFGLLLNSCWEQFPKEIVLSSAHPAKTVCCQVTSIQGPEYSR